MPAYNFKSQFEPHILSGRKRHTIRNHRAAPTRPGDTLYLYVGQRTRKCRRIAVGFCTRVQEIELREYLGLGVQVRIDGEILSTSECEQLARADGFDNFGEMTRFWAGRLPFKGVIIHWEPLK